MRPHDTGDGAVMAAGPPPPDVSGLVRVQDRLSFLYLERSMVHRDSNAITATNDQGVVHIPAASIGVIMFGPGVSVSHQAMLLLAESGSTAVWVGEEGVRYYAHGRSLSRSSRLLLVQAALVSNQSSRLRVARTMYDMRFPDEDTSRLTMQQLRGREGARVRRAYQAASEEYGVSWTGRDYDPDEFTASDPVNQALSAATAALYGITHAVIVALGCSPGLGFVHTGHVRSFVFDIADLYKAEIAIPCAFKVAARDFEDVSGETRRAMRDAFHTTRLMERCAHDIKALLTEDPTGSDQLPLDDNVVELWDGRHGSVPGGVSYGDLGW